MNRWTKLSMVSVSYFLVVCYIFVQNQSQQSLVMSLFLMPFVILMGYYEKNAGIIVSTIVTAVVVLILQISGEGQPGQAAAIIALLGILFVFTIVCFNKHDSVAEVEDIEKKHLESDKRIIEYKVSNLRSQVREHEGQLKTLFKLYDASKRFSNMMELEGMLEEARVVLAKSMPRIFNPNSEYQANLAFYIFEENQGGFQRIANPDQEIPDEVLPISVEYLKLKSTLDNSLNSIKINDLFINNAIQELVGNNELRSLLIVPLIIQDQPIGLLLLASRIPSAFTSADFNKAAVLGKQIVFAMRKAMLYKKVERLSITDSQTGLFVHRYFQNRFNEELHRAERYNQSISLLMIDIDFFKKVNDTHGHQVGDVVLTEVAQRIKHMAGAIAITARYGGEEFAVLLPNYPKNKALVIAQSIHSFIAATPIEIRDLKLNVTVSIGASSYPQDAIEMNDIIQKADQALYTAKENGRNQVVS